MSDTILRVEIIGLHQGRLVAEINGIQIVQDREYLIRRLGDLRRYGYGEVRIRPNAHATSWRERIEVDESVLTTLVNAFDRDIAEIETCQPWSARDTCDEPGIYDIEGRPLCAAHLPDDNYYHPED